MYSPEMVQKQGGTEKRTPERSREEEMFLENMLQMGWFKERYENLSQNEVQQRLEKIASSDGESMRERIKNSDEAGRQEIVLEDMILSSTGEGGPERKWFRDVFLSMTESNAILARFEEDPELAAKEVEALYRKSLH